MQKTFTCQTTHLTSQGQLVAREPLGADREDAAIGDLAPAARGVDESRSSLGNEAFETCDQLIPIPIYRDPLPELEHLNRSELLDQKQELLLAVLRAGAVAFPDAHWSHQDLNQLRL